MLIQLSVVPQSCPHVRLEANLLRTSDLRKESEERCLLIFHIECANRLEAVYPFVAKSCDVFFILWRVFDEARARHEEELPFGEILVGADVGVVHSLIVNELLNHLFYHL